MPFLTNDQAAKTLQTEIRAMALRCEIFKGDLANESNIVARFNMIDAKLGRLNALVNNTALMLPQIRIAQVTEQRLNQLFSTHITSYFLCAREALLRMAYKHGGSGGSIVNVSSLAAITGSPHEYID
jgi:NAD(P)-dependent dehydrogenase (short-subunit alcohol dehydrogenase family)